MDHLRYEDLSLTKIDTLRYIAEQLAETYPEDECENDPSQLFLYHVYYVKDTEKNKLYIGIADMQGYFAPAEPDIMEEVYERETKCYIVFYSDVWEDALTVQEWLIDHFDTRDKRYGYNSPDYN